ncbi:MAG: selenocysteine-specific translation elongation factor [Pseudomonadota bacterium]
MIVATAGHIDHGKTSLVKRLTGVDTDRLPEEKARGISIDLGFAYLPMAEGGLIGFVDVPGHEKFISNMLAGVGGIDFALLVVAADDGVMPQTREHLQILDLLQLKLGAAVITKSDRVDADRLLEVRCAVEDLLEGSSLVGAPVIEVSAVTGDGIDGLRDLLVEQSRSLAARLTEGQYFRFAVDRAFSISGSGTVLTGTVFSGAVNTGDQIVISPSGEQARVRGIQIHGKVAGRVAAGERCALNLARTRLQSVRRGDWVVAPELHRPTTRIDVRLRVDASEAQPVRHWTPVHVHLATCDVTARVAIRRGASVAPGESAIVQLVLDNPIGALRGDRLIVRDQSASRTVGGAIVLDPFAPATRRAVPARLSQLAALEHEEAGAALAAMSANAKSIDLEHFEVAYNLTRSRAGRLCEAAQLVTLGRDTRTAVTLARYYALRANLLGALAAFHKRQPQAPGQEVDKLRQLLAPDLEANAFATILGSLADERKVEHSAAIVRMPGHVATANDADDQLWQRVLPAIETGGYLAPSVPQLAERLHVREAVIKDFLHRKARSGDVMKVTPDRYFLRSRLADLAAAAKATALAQPDHRFTAAHFRDASGIGRNHVIEVLEFFDVLGITRRFGNTRMMNKDFVAILGAGTAPLRSAHAATANDGQAPRTAASQRARR